MSYKNAYPNEFSSIKSFLELRLDETVNFGFPCSIGSDILEEIFESLDDAKKDKTAKELIKWSGEIHQNLIDIYISYVEKKSAILTAKINAPVPVNEKQLVFSAAEAKKITGRSKDTINKYLNTGKIKGEKDAGNRWRIQRSALTKYLKHDNF